MSNAINWFELPTSNFDRAVKFYAEILGGPVQVVENGEMKMGMLPNFSTQGGVGGHLASGTGATPSDKGTLVYLNGGSDLNGILGKVEKAGGKVLVKKTKSPGGYMGIFLDSEGNRVAVHNP